MEITGKITNVLEIQTGEGKNGQWRKQDYVLETSGEYPKKICFTVWGDRIEQFAIKEGEDLKAEIDLESREYNGRWYTNVKAFRVEKSGAIAPFDGIDQIPADNVPPAAAPPDEAAEAEDDLPF